MPQLSIQQAYDLAMQQLRAGRLAEAEQLFRQVLGRKPDHAGALHYLGVVAHQAGQNAISLQLIRQAIAVRPNWPEAYYNLGYVLRAVGQLDEAIAAFRRAITLQPNYVEAHNNLAISLTSAGQLDESIALCRRMIAIDPNFADAHNNLGLALQAKGQLDAAIGAITQAVAVKPQYAEGHNNLAMALREKHRLDEAIQSCRRAIAIKPGYAEAYNNLGILFYDKGQFEQATATLRHAVALKPGYAQAWSNLGNALRANKQLGQAITSLRQAIALNPNAADFHDNLGNALRDSGKLDDAIAAFRQAIALDPGAAQSHNDLANALKDQGDFEQAITEARRAIALDPNLAEAHNNLALLLLMTGNFSQGWSEYEWRWRWKDFPSPRQDFHQPQWNGLDLAGRTIFLVPEQGFGDVIQFVRYVPLIAAGGGKVIVGCSPKLRRLFQSLAGVTRIVSLDEPLPEFDVHCPLLSLPLVMGTTLENVPASVPYLHATAQDTEHWQKQLGPADGQIRIGLAWAGNPAHLNNQNRSMPLAALAPLADVPNARFYSLQVGGPATQANAPGLNPIDLTENLHDFADTAALVSNLDLVITVDTSVAHLAGALAKPVWTLHSFIPDWRWMLQRNDSPWYPSMRLFRQPAPGDWSSVIQSVKLALQNFTTDSGKRLR